MYTEYAYIKLRYLRWAVSPNGQSLVYVNLSKMAVWNMSQIAFPQQSLLVKD